MSNDWNSQSKDFPEPDLKQTNQIGQRGWITAQTLIRLTSRLLKRIKIITLSAVLARFPRLGSKSSRMKKGTTIAALVMAIILAGHIVSAQIAPLPSLKTVSVPKPENLREFVQDKTAAIALGKALFLGYTGRKRWYHVMC